MSDPDQPDRCMERRHRGAALACLAALTAASCAPAPGPEQAIRLWVDEAAAAFEAGDRRKLLDMISDNYVDTRGHEREDVDRLLRLHFLRNREASMASKINEVTVIADTAASVSLTAGMVGGDGGTFGFRADAWNVELELEKHGDSWLLIGARWSPLGERPY
jgi:hypothetical protein